MVPEFQSSLLKFIFQDKRAKRYINLLDPNIFDLGSHEQLFDWLKLYIKKYRTVPSKINFIEYMDRQTKRSKVAIPDEVYQSWRNAISQAYSPWQGDISLIEDVLIEEMQKKQTKNLFSEYADKIKTADDDTFSKISVQMSKIAKLRQEGLEAVKMTGRFLVKDRKKHFDEIPEGQPIFLDALNRMTAAGGFYTPQLIALMGGPKCFKTGILLNVAIDLLRKGKKVLYIDCENGESNISIRFKQCLLDCTRGEVSKYKKELDSILSLIEKFGGDIRIEYFPKNSTLDQVELKMHELKEEENFAPEVIIWDYLDLFKSADKKLGSADKRLHIQDVYHHAIKIHNNWNCWGITVSTVKAAAINKLIIDVQDFGEDSQKAYNCHAAFAICRTKTEMSDGTARIIPVVQREGAPFRGDIDSTCAVKFNEANMQIEEMDAETYMYAMNEVLEEDTKIAKKAQQYRRSMNIVDE